MRNKLIISSLFLALALVSSANARNLGGGFEGPGIDSVTVSDIQKMTDDTHGVMVGNIDKSLGNEESMGIKFQSSSFITNDHGIK